MRSLFPNVVLVILLLCLCQCHTSIKLSVSVKAPASLLVGAQLRATGGCLSDLAEPDSDSEKRLHLQIHGCTQMQRKGFRRRGTRGRTCWVCAVALEIFSCGGPRCGARGLRRAPPLACRRETGGNVFFPEVTCHVSSLLAMPNQTANSLHSTCSWFWSRLFWEWIHQRACVRVCECVRE